MASEWMIQEEMLSSFQIPEKLRKGFEHATSGIEGVHYVPILFCAVRIENGVDYMFICSQTIEEEIESKKHFVKVIIHADLPEDGGNFYANSIDLIV